MIILYSWVVLTYFTLLSLMQPSSICFQIVLIKLTYWKIASIKLCRLYFDFPLNIGEMNRKRVFLNVTHSLWSKNVVICFHTSFVWYHCWTIFLVYDEGKMTEFSWNCLKFGSTQSGVHYGNFILEILFVSWMNFL